MNKLTLAIAAALAFANVSTQAAERTLDASVLAEVVVSGGFMAPGRSNTSIYTFKTNGEIDRTTYKGLNGEKETQLVGKLSPSTQARLERSMALIDATGKLVDVDPNSPTGADAPNLSFNINRDGNALTVAVRRGDFHLYALENQKAALTIKALLERSIFKTH